MRARLLSDKQIEWAKERYAEGYYQREIADALFVCEVTIHNLLKGVKKLARTKLIYDGSDRDEFIRTKYYEGYQQKEIAEALGTYSMKIFHYCKKHRLKQKPRAKLVYDFSKE